MNELSDDKEFPLILRRNMRQQYTSSKDNRKLSAFNKLKAVMKNRIFVYQG